MSNLVRTFASAKPRWCHSSVGRAKDWKSLCPRFDSWWHHTKKETQKVSFFVSQHPCGPLLLSFLPLDFWSFPPVFWPFYPWLLIFSHCFLTLWPLSLDALTLDFLSSSPIRRVNFSDSSRSFAPCDTSKSADFIEPTFPKTPISSRFCAFCLM